MSQVAQNLRFGFRMIAKQPTVAAISILALSLGIGLTTTMYSIVRGALRDLPVENGHEILHLSRTNLSQGITSMGISQHDFVAWRDQQSSFDGLGGYWQGTINVSGTERPIRFEGAFITPESFRILGVGPQIGRIFDVRDSQPGAPPALLISDRVWRNQFQGAPGVLGQEMRINGTPGTIVGVMPPGFAFPMAEEAWLPIQFDFSELQRGEGTHLNAFGRLRAGVSLDGAMEEFNGLAARLEEQYPDTNEGVRVTAQPFVREYVDTAAVAMLWTMQGAVFMVLIIACANVANLLLSRAIDRSKEVAVRTALGAGRGRIVGQFLTEVLVMAAIGGVIGLAIAQVGVTLFRGQLADILVPYWIDIRLDWQILAFASLMVVGASVVAGLVPALQVSGGSLADVLKDEARGSSGFRVGRISKALVVAEVALSCGLLVGAGLMIKSVAQLSTFDYGFPTDVFSARLGLFPGDYPEAEDRAQFWQELHRRLGEQSGTLGAALTDAPPGTQRASMGRISIDGEAYATREDHPLANFAMVTPGFFDTFTVELLEGRDFNVLDGADTEPVAIVNRSFATRMFPDGPPLGRRFKLGVDADDGNPWLTVVGIAPDMHMEGMVTIDGREPQGFYTPVAQQDPRFLSIVVRTASEPMGISPAVRQTVASISPDTPIYWVQTLQTMIDSDIWFYDVFGKLFMVFGFAALLLATIGLYGVMSFAIRRRTQEVGIRMALGARGSDVIGMVMRQGLWQIVVGLVIGLGLAALAAGGLELVLFEVDPRDVSVYGAITVVLGSTGLLACLLPARRASRTNPVTALRQT